MRGRKPAARGARGSPRSARRPTNPKPSSPLTPVSIEGLEVDGTGFGEAEGGRTIFVPGVLPGEEVLVAIERHSVASERSFARLRQVVKPSPDRVEPGCRQFLICGGCDFLHASDEAELAFKRSRVAKALKLPLDKVDPVVPSPRADHYRAVAKLVLGPGGRLGSYAPRSHRVVDMDGCRIHAPVIERVADVVRRRLREGASYEGVRYLVLRAALPRAVVHATVVVTTPGAEHDLLAVLASHAEVAEVWRHTNRSEGDAIFDPDGTTICLHRGAEAVGRVGTAEQHMASGAFAQVNPGAAERLYERVADRIEPDGQNVLDLYSGSGGIALTLAARGANEVLGIERSPEAVDAARKAASGFRGRVRFEAGAAEAVQSFLRSREAGPPVPGEGGGFPAWVVNPPRKGLAPEVIHAAQVLRPRRIVYVSCHPDRLARDVELLAELYELDTVTPVDMFPQTRHIETVARLEMRRELPEIG